MGDRVMIDHVPGRSVAEASVSERLKFLRRVYGWMTAALLLTGVSAMISIESGLVLATMGGGMVTWILTMVAWIGLAWVVQKVRHQPVVNVIAYAAYAAMTGFVISGIVYVAMAFGAATTGSSGTYVLQALGLTTLVFGGLTVYAFTTKRDFSFLRGFLVVATFGLLGAIIISFFVQSTVLGLIISVFGVLLFSGYVLFDTQKILKTYPNNEHVAASVELFTDFVLLFVYILRTILYIAAASQE